MPEQEEPSVIVINSVTVSEVIDADGDRYLTVSHSEGTEYWQLIGMLQSALVTSKEELAVYVREACYSEEDDE